VRNLSKKEAEAGKGIVYHSDPAALSGRRCADSQGFCLPAVFRQHRRWLGLPSLQPIHSFSRVQGI
jgi:hypothetical protein